MKILSTLSFVFILGTAFVLWPVHSSGQQPPTQPDLPIDAATRVAVIDTLMKELNDSYVFPDVAKKMEIEIRARVTAKEYDSITSSREFAQKLTADLQSVSKDKHLRVRYSHDVLPVRNERREPSESEIAQNKWHNRRVNFGVEKVERLNGNIGYVDLRGFNDHDAGAETVAAAMAFLQHTEALIFDL